MLVGGAGPNRTDEKCISCKDTGLNLLAYSPKYIYFPFTFVNFFFQQPLKNLTIQIANIK